MHGGLEMVRKDEREAAHPRYVDKHSSAEWRVEK
jgi:hypothetical protein